MALPFDKLNKSAKKAADKGKKEKQQKTTQAKVTKKATAKKSVSNYTKAAKNNTGITGGAAKAAKTNKTTKGNSTKKAAKKTTKKSTSKNLTSNEALLLQNLTRTGSKKVVTQGKKNAAKALTTSKAKTNEYKNLTEKTAKKKTKATKQLTSNESLLLQNLTRTGTADVVNKGLKGAGKTLRTSKAKTDEYKDLNKKVAKQDEKFLNSSPFAYGVMAGSSPIPLKETLEKQTGQKIDTSKAENTVGYKAGYMAGLMGEYAATGGIARGAVEQSIKTTLKQAGKTAGKKAVKEAAKEATEQVTKNSSKLTQIGKKVLTGAAADTVTGVPTNALEAGKETSKAEKGEKGKTFARSMALNTAFDVGLGAGGEVVSAAMKAIKKRAASKAAQAVTGTTETPTKAADTAVQNTTPKVTETPARADTAQASDAVAKTSTKTKPDGVATIETKTLDETLLPLKEAREEVPKAPEGASDIVKKAEQRKVQQVAEEKAEVNTASLEEARAELMAAKEYIDELKATYKAERERLVDEYEEYVKNYKSKGTLTWLRPTEYGYGFDMRETASFNDDWYRRWYKEHKRPPAKKNARWIAEDIVDRIFTGETKDFPDEDLHALYKTISSENEIYESLAAERGLTKAQREALADIFDDEDARGIFIDSDEYFDQFFPLLGTTKTDALKKDLGADVNKTLPVYKESTAAANEVRPEGEKVMYETETHARREQAAKDRLVTDYDGEYKDLLSKDEYTSEDLATMGEMLNREKTNFSRFYKLTKKAAEVSSRKGQELEAVKHIKENTAAGKAIKAEQASQRSVKELEKVNPRKLEQTETQAKETIKEIDKAVNTAVDETVENILSMHGTLRIMPRVEKQANVKNALTKYKEAGGKQVADKLTGATKTTDKAELQKSFDIMLKDVTDLIGKTKQKQAVKAEIEKFAKSVFERKANREDFAQVFDYAENVLRKNGSYTEAVEKRLKEVKKSFEGDYSNARLGKAVDEALKNAQIEIRQIMKQSKSVKTEAKDTVVDTITRKLKECGVDDETVKTIVDDAAKIFDSKLETAAKKYLTQRFAPKGKPVRKTMIEDVIELIHMGAYDDADIVSLMRAKNGVKVLTPQQAKEISDYMGIYEQKPKTREGAEALARANKIIANLEGANFGDRFRSVQRVSMLFNPKTWFSRNAGGNLLLSAAENIKDIPAAAIDCLVALKTGERTTQGITLGKLKAQGKGMAKGTKEQILDIRHGVDTAASRTKYEMPNKDVWNNKPMQKLDTLIGQLLQLGDRPFYEAAYNSRKAELEALAKKGKTSLTSKEIEESAKMFALDRVFQADTSLSKAAQSMRKAFNDIGDNGILGNIIMPFVQTPANILDKLISYSPAGLIKVVRELSRVRKGTFDQKVFVDTLGRMFTGAGVITLGYALAKKDAMTVDLYAQSDRNQQVQKAYEKQGLQSYAINLGNGTSFNIDWASPIGSLMIMGAEAYFGGADEKDLVSSLYGGGLAAADSVFSNSFLQGVSTLFSSYDGSISEGFANTILSATSQPLPSVIQQLTRVIDPYKRETYDSNPLKKQLNTLMSKTPVLSTMLPAKKDITGQSVEQFQGRGTISKLLEAYLYPANISEKKYNNVNDEAIRVYEATGETGALLKVGEKSFEYGDTKYRLESAEDMSRFMQVQGEEAYNELSKLISSKEYKNLSDNEKASAINRVTLKAKEKAEDDYLVRKGKYTQTELDFAKLSSQERKGYASVDMTKKAYIEIMNTADTYNEDGKYNLTQAEFTKYVNENNVSNSTARQLWIAYGWSPNTNPY